MNELWVNEDEDVDEDEDNYISINEILDVMCSI